MAIVVATLPSVALQSRHKPSNPLYIPGTQRPQKGPLWPSRQRPSPYVSMALSRAASGTATPVATWAEKRAWVDYAFGVFEQADVGADGLDLILAHRLG